jgi:ubiquinone/menaquinone biosynthesis C-methylase UbiE
MLRETTATFDAADWTTYWASGRRDLELLLEVAKEAGLLRCDFAIDLGCGIGRITHLLASVFQRVVGVDISSEMLRRALERSMAPNIGYEQVGKNGKLPVHAGVADLVIAWTVFRHVAKSVFAGYLDEAYRVLKPGGCLVFEAQIRESGTCAEPPPYDSFTEREYTRPELATYSSAHGFRWAAERTTVSVTPRTSTLILGWVKECPG